MPLIVSAFASGLLFGLITGVAKLRVAGAEARAYARWAEGFAEQRRRTFAAQRAANLQTSFNARVPRRSDGRAHLAPAPAPARAPAPGPARHA